MSPLYSAFRRVARPQKRTGLPMVRGSGSAANDRVPVAHPGTRTHPADSPCSWAEPSDKQRPSHPRFYAKNSDRQMPHVAMSWRGVFRRRIQTAKSYTWRSDAGIPAGAPEIAVSGPSTPGIWRSDWRSELAPPRTRFLPPGAHDSLRTCMKSGTSILPGGLGASDGWQRQGRRLCAGIADGGGTKPSASSEDSACRCHPLLSWVLIHVLRQPPWRGRLGLTNAPFCVEGPSPLRVAGILPALLCDGNALSDTDPHGFLAESCSSPQETQGRKMKR